MKLIHMGINFTTTEVINRGAFLKIISLSPTFKACTPKLFLVNMGRNKKVTCEECFRFMRSDTLKRHMKQHEDRKSEACGVSLSSSGSWLNTESDFSSDSTINSYEISSMEREKIINKLRKDNEEYKYKMERGKLLYEEVNQQGIQEESLCQEYKELLDIFRKQKKNIDIENVILRPWQESLLEYMNPSDREIIWVIGVHGNEGKSWFQEFLESKFGWHRAVCGMDIKMKKGNICHALRKRSLMSTNVFLFDVGKSKTFDEINYGVLEKIKNGRIVADKYNTAELKFYTPNIVVVFSNG